jgi:hypothetical protein
MYFITTFLRHRGFILLHVNRIFRLCTGLSNTTFLNIYQIAYYEMQVNKPKNQQKGVNIILYIYTNL